MRQSILGILVCLLLSGLAVTGCGGGGSDSTSATDGSTAASTDGSGGEAGADAGSGGGGEAAPVEASSESKEEFIASADQVCKQQLNSIESKVSSLFADTQNNSQAETMRRFVNGAIAPGLEAEAEELRELGAPEGDEEQLEELADAIEKIAGRAREEPKAFVTQPAEFTEANELASEYGIDSCGTVRR